ncbi:MAG: 16S rRNA (cytosine(967)-C(5))-methyltransferase RsmB [Pseudomonadota bacterium]
MSARRHALAVITDVQHGRSLSIALPEQLEQLPARERGLCQELCYGTLRYYQRYEWLAAQLLKKPFKPKDADLQAILALGFYQIFETRIPDHAAVGDTVSLVNHCDKGWSRGVINAVLRNAARQRDDWRAAFERKEPARFSMPRWMLQFLKGNWPDHWRDIADACLERPPMTLRIAGGDREAYRQRLAEVDIPSTPIDGSPWALALESPVDVQRLPGFTEGEVSIQDAAAQLAAVLLDPQAGERVLDACAAPGGKTGHLLEWAAGLAVTALDLEPDRLTRVNDNLKRLGKRAELVAGDLRQTGQWWDGQAFDRILLDAPCSASGVLRRHPDIKLLRRAEDINALVELQAQCLDAAWQTLRPGGTLLYATCSIFKAENEHQIHQFLERQRDASLSPLQSGTLDTGWIDTGFGHQLLPGNPMNADGFFYARLVKSGDGAVKPAQSV